MATLSRAQMQFYAAAAGLPSPPLWAEVGMAESSGRTDVVNEIGAVGWLQINQPVQVKSHPTWTVSWLKDPLHNAQAAKVLFDADRKAGGSGMGPWEASQPAWGAKAKQAGWLNGLGNLIEPGLGSILPGGGLDPGGLVDTATATAEEISRLAQATAKAGNWLSNPRNWIRIVYVGAGAVLTVAGLQMVVQSKAVDKLGKLTGGAVTSKAKALRPARTPPAPAKKTPAKKAPATKKAPAKKAPAPTAPAPEEAPAAPAPAPEEGQDDE